MALRPPVIEQLMKQLSVMKSDKIPILIYNRSTDGKSPIDIAIEHNDFNATKILLDMMIKF